MNSHQRRIRRRARARLTTTYPLWQPTGETKGVLTMAMAYQAVKDLSNETT